MSDLILIYITCNDEAEARKIGTHLLKKRLSGCINIINGMNSVYWWPPKAGQLEEGKETILIVKTIRSKFDEIEKEVIGIHSSDTPCLIAIPTVAVAQKYADWIKGEIG